MRENELNRIIKAENLLQEGVDPRKIFSFLQGPPGDNFDHYTVYLPCVGYGWIIQKEEGYELLSRDVWYTESGIFRNGKCTIGMGRDKNWIDEKGKILRPDEWLDGVRDFNDMGVAIGKLDGRFCWFNNEGKQLSENWYDSIREIEDDHSLFLIHDREKGYNLSRPDGIPLLSSWYFYVSPVYPKEKSAVVARERFDSSGEYESCILDLDSGKELCEWYTWIGGFEALAKWGIVVQREVGNEDRFNFINARGKLYSSREWYRKNKGGNLVDSSGNIIEKPI